MNMKLKLDGMAALQRKTDGMAKRLAKATDELLREKANRIMSDARSRCDDHAIASEIYALKTDNGYQVTTRTKFSAYLEFGTGNYAEILLASYPSEWVEMAWQFYVNGLGRTPARPYLYPAYTAHTTNITNDLVKLIG